MISAGVWRTRLVEMRRKEIGSVENGERKRIILVDGFSREVEVEEGNRGFRPVSRIWVLWVTRYRDVMFPHRTTLIRARYLVEVLKPCRILPSRQTLIRVLSSHSFGTCGLHDAVYTSLFHILRWSSSERLCRQCNIPWPAIITRSDLRGIFKHKAVFTQTQ